MLRAIASRDWVRKGVILAEKVNGSGSPDTDSFYCVRNGTICGESLGVGTGDVYNVGESGVWEELVDDFRVSREEVMDVKRRDGVRLRFNELVHMVFTGRRKRYELGEAWFGKCK